MAFVTKNRFTNSGKALYLFLNLNVIMTMPANFDEIIQQNSDAYRTLIASTGKT